MCACQWEHLALHHHRPPGQSIVGHLVPGSDRVLDPVGEQYVDARPIVAGHGGTGRRIRCASSASAHPPLHDDVVWGALVHDEPAHDIAARFSGRQFAAWQRFGLESWWRRRR